MARKKTTGNTKTAKNTKNNNNSKNTRSTKKQSGNNSVEKPMVFELKLIVMVLLTTLVLFSVYGFKPGIVGDFINFSLFGLFSYTAYIVPFILISLLMIKYIKKLNESSKKYKISIISLFFGVVLIVGLITKENVFYNIFDLSAFGEIYNLGIKMKNAGLVGNLIFAPLYSVLGDIGVILLITACFLVFLSLVSRLTFSKILLFFGKTVKNTGDKAVEKGKELGNHISGGIDKMKEDKPLIEFESKKESSDYYPREKIHVIDAFMDLKNTPEKKDDFRFIDTEKGKKQITDEKFIENELDISEEKTNEFKFIDIPNNRAKSFKETKTTKEDVSEEENIIISSSLENVENNDYKTQLSEKNIKNENKEEHKKTSKKENDSPNDEISDFDNLSEDTDFEENIEKEYQLPPMSILLRGENQNDVAGKNVIHEKAKILEETFKSFKVDAKVISAERGPMITRFEVKPMSGVKISKIEALNDDIAMKLAATNVRILAPIPGKAAVGIEVPNESVSVVRLRDVLESEDYTKDSSLIRFGLGKDISGKDIVADLSKMPHLLIAGATGSGKSVCVNTIISSILFNAKPEEVKFLMIDPKVVELNVYNGIPHLLLPVVTDPTKASVALNWAVNEMNKRYSLFAKLKVRDINSYNQKREDIPDLEAEFMPRVVIIIDELADLMMVVKKQVEESIARIAQMARAAGMHLIVATQRPSVDVITGLIKANIPSRIAFAVSSQIDSRTILDEQGAEKLLGKGDMLFLNAGKSKPTRVQGSFITDTEVEALVSFVKNQIEGEPEYSEEVLESQNIQMDMGNGEESDSLLEAAIEFVIQSEKASTSMVQRKFKIGYNRAARIIEEMEARGIVGPSQGSKPREVLVGTGYINNQDIAFSHEEGEMAE